ncbi:MAG: NADH-quinone oxidoreductase subunit N [Armatimonadetes bacterium]|nr:NADH-quinone oxidoreductase subunit N [Armatimonadota bacterium]
MGGLLLALIPTWGLAGAVHRPGTTVFFGSYAVDGFAVFFKVLAIIATTLVILASMDYFRASGEREAAGAGRFEGEFYTLLVFTGLGLVLMAASADLILVALSIEFVSLTSYVLAAYLKGNPKSNEAGLKYFLFGAAASAVMFYGFSLLYGLTGSTSLYVIAEKVATAPASALVVALALMLAGFGFKISMVPFHQWTPDVYEGAPTPVAAFLSVGSKAAGFAVLLRVVVVAIAPSGLDYITLIAGLSAVSMFLGNLLALPQRNIKRMLAYSSISHAGFLLIAPAAYGATFGNPGLLLYILAYTFTNLGAFFVAIVIGLRLTSDDINDYAGLSRRAPALAVTMTIFMLSLTGIPPMGVFLGKYYVLAAAIEKNLIWLAAVAIANSVISLYYYANVIRVMYLTPPAVDTAVQEPWTLRTALAVTAVGTLAMGLYPEPFIHLAKAASVLLLSL